MANIKPGASYEVSKVSHFIASRIESLSSRKTQKQIANAVGYDKANVLSMIKRGDAKLPLEKVPAMARELEVDPGHLLRLALEQYWPEMNDMISDMFGNTVSPNEMEVIREVRRQTKSLDPKMNAAQKRAIAEILKSPDPQAAGVLREPEAKAS